MPSGTAQSGGFPKAGDVVQILAQRSYDDVRQIYGSLLQAPSILYKACHCSRKTVGHAYCTVPGARKP
jgi:hypothetical protein